MLRAAAIKILSPDTPESLQIEGSGCGAKEVYCQLYNGFQYLIQHPTSIAKRGVSYE